MIFLHICAECAYLCLLPVAYISITNNLLTHWWFCRKWVSLSLVNYVCSCYWQFLCASVSSRLCVLLSLASCICSRHWLFSLCMHDPAVCKSSSHQSHLTLSLIILLCMYDLVDCVSCCWQFGCGSMLLQAVCISGSHQCHISLLLMILYICVPPVCLYLHLSTLSCLLLTDKFAYWWSYRGCVSLSPIWHLFVADNPTAGKNAVIQHNSTGIRVDFWIFEYVRHLKL